MFSCQDRIRLGHVSFFFSNYTWYVCNPTSTTTSRPRYVYWFTIITSYFSAAIRRLPGSPFLHCTQVLRSSSHSLSPCISLCTLAHYFFAFFAVHPGCFSYSTKPSADISSDPLCSSTEAGSGGGGGEGAYSTRARVRSAGVIPRLGYCRTF